MNSSRTAYPRHELDDFTPGWVREQRFSVSREDLVRFSDMTADHHPLHCAQEFSQQCGYPDVLVHGMLVASRCSAFVAHDFVGSHGLLVSLAADFRQPAYCGEELVWRAEVVRVTAEAGTVEIRWQVSKERGLIVQRGTACAWLPRRR